jgi:Phosphotransferase enzyme family
LVEHLHGKDGWIGARRRKTAFWADLEKTGTPVEAILRRPLLNPGLDTERPPRRRPLVLLDLAYVASSGARCRRCRCVPTVAAVLTTAAASPSLRPRATVDAVIEIHLSGGRVTEGVVRIGNTVRRPSKPNFAFVRALLAHLSDEGFDAAPRYLGLDEQGREILSFQPGQVPGEIDSTLCDETLVAAAQLIRAYHDATAGSALAGEDEVVCHNDLSPCNVVFRDGKPVGIIDFDAAAPGARLQDIGYAIFLWLNVGTEGLRPSEQARRIRLFCDAYGIEPDAKVIDAIVDAVAANVERLRADQRFSDAEWWKAQLDWIAEHRAELDPSRPK